MKEFKVNKYLSLKLKGKSTIIYVKGKQFHQCKFLLLNIRVDEITSLDEIESIDEAATELDRSLEPHKGQVNLIPPEVEFWGHCSNLQVWAENNYDTRLLHRNLAFPLLKKLTEAGDPIAKSVFKEEIAKRIASGYSYIVNYLVLEGYMNYFNEKELEDLLGDYEFVEHKGKKVICIKGILDLSGRKIKDLNEIKGLFSLTSLKRLYLHNNQLSSLPESIGNLISLRRLDLSTNKLTIIPDSIGNMISLRRLEIRGNKLNQLPDSIGNLKSLTLLNLVANKIINLPDSIKKLELLDLLALNFNKLRSFPKTICHLKTLRYLFLEENKINKIPECIGNLSLLIELHLGNNLLLTLPDSMSKLTSLKVLELWSNRLESLPEKIENLETLEKLDLKFNKLNELPESITNLTSLKQLYISKKLYKNSCKN